MKSCKIVGRQKTNGPKPMRFRGGNLLTTFFSSLPPQNCRASAANVHMYRLGTADCVFSHPFNILFWIRHKSTYRTFLHITGKQSSNKEQARHNNPQSFRSIRSGACGGHPPSQWTRLGLRWYFAWVYFRFLLNLLWMRSNILLPLIDKPCCCHIS